MFDTHRATGSSRERRNHAARYALTQRISGEFQEMPCLRLTAAQAQRLFGLRAEVCQRILLNLVQQGSLTFEGDMYRFNDARGWPAAGRYSHGSLTPSKAA